MTSGGGFEQGSDYVAARVSIDVDGSSIQTMREMGQEIDRIRTSTEAAARSSSSFKSYLDAVTQAASAATNMHRELASQMERTAEMQQRMMGGAGGSSSSALPLNRLAPQGYVDPWAGMGAGMGGTRAPNPSDIQAQLQSQQIDPTRQLDPRKYINAQAGRYNVNPGELPAQNLDEPALRTTADRIDARERQGREQEERVNAPPGVSPAVQSLTGRIGQYSGLASNIMNEMQPGGSHAGMISLAARGAQALGKSLSGGKRTSGAVRAGEGSDAEGTGTAKAANAGDAASAEEAASSGGLGSMLGGAGAVAGMGLTGVAALEKGGSIYQGYKNMGLIRGGGAAQGFGDEMSIRTMALNPFLTTEQSRQIIMAGLTEGYSGKQFDNVTQFMAQNLKDMNLSVSDSVQLLRKNVNEGGQSIAGLGASLSVLKGMAPGSAMSLPDMQQNFAQTTSSLVSSGMSGGMASQEALGGMGVFGDDQTLKGSFNETMTAMASSATGGAMLKAMGGANLPPGLDPSMAAAWLSDHGGGLGQATGQWMQTMYQRAFSAPGSKTPGSVQSYNALKRFMRMLGMFNPQNPAASSVDAAKDLVSKLSNGKNPFDEGKQKADSASSQLTGPEGMAAGFGDQLGAAWRSVVDIGKGAAGLLTGNTTAAGNAMDDMGKVWDNVGYREFEGAESPVMNNVVGQLGAGNVQVVDSQGNASSLTGSKQQMSDLASGKLKWRPKGSTGDGYSLSQTPSAGNVVPGGSSQTNVNFSPAQVQITIDNQGRATANPSTVNLAPNVAQAQAGMGSATVNDPLSGNGFDQGKYNF